MLNKIWFDMDGTIADLYAVDGWLDMLRNFETTPYEMAKPMIRMTTFARYLNSIQSKGIEIGIISWCSKVSDEAYDNRIAQAKREWLAKHLPSVHWDNIEVVPYGTPKHEVCGFGYLFDDEEKNRTEWNANAGIAYEPCDIMEFLSILNKII